MIYRPLANTGIEVSALGFGAMRLPMITIGGTEYVDMDLAVETIRHAMDNGVNYIASGLLYCSSESELAVGRAIRGRRNDVILTTKATKMRMDAPGDLRRMLEHQLRKLDVDYVDFYCFHGIGWENFHSLDEKTDWLTDMMQAKDEGLVKHIGFSFHDEPENMRKLVDLGFFEMVTCQYNYLDTKNADAMAYAAEKGLAVVVMGPVGGGRLAQLPGFLREREGLEISDAAALALRYVISNPSVTVVLSGMGSVEMVDDNIAAVEAGPIDHDEQRIIDSLLIHTKGLAELYCTGCGYCLPCPQGVKIAERFTAMNYYKVYGMEQHARETYRLIREREQDSDGQGDCIHCGVCEDKCPQSIPIFEQLKETESALGID